MLQTMLLSKVLGVFLIAVGAVILFRRHYFLPVFAAFARERLIRTVISFVELLGGLFLALNNDWSSVPAALITLVGWMAVAESVVYLTLPDELVETFIRAFNTSFWYVVGGLLSIAAGGCLAAYGFGLVGPG